MDGQRKKELLLELSSSDISRYCVEVHGLKSASANIGAMALSDMARAQEDAASQGDRPYIAQQFPQLLEAYEALLMNIGVFLERRRQGDAKEKLPPLPIQALQEQAGAALHELEEFRSQECLGMVESLLDHELPQDAADSLWEIHRQLKLFEDDNAESLLRQFLRELEEDKSE